jgi:anti-anti-sigma factor
VELSTESKDGWSRVSVAGDIDLATAATLAATGVGLVREHRPRTLHLDLSRVSFIDSTGIGALVEIKNAADGDGVRLVVADPSPRVVEVLELTGMTDVFTIQAGPTLNASQSLDPSMCLLPRQVDT